MKVLFIGAGSIGKRHIRDFYLECKKNNEIPEIHVLRRQIGNLGDIEEYISRQITEINDEYYDVVFITNPTNLHYDALEKCSGHADYYFIEKPIFESVDYNYNKLGINSKNAYVAAPMRHTYLYKRLKEIVKTNKVYSSHVICSSYLPEWRPSIDYRKNYSAIKEMGGGVNLDLIHEIDYIYGLFGEPMLSYCLSGKYSDLEISSNDLSIYILKYENMLCEVHLDYFGREYTRTCELYTEPGKFTADYHKETIKHPDGTIEDCHVEPNEEFINEMAYFFRFIKGYEPSINPPELAMKNLAIATKGVWNNNER